MATPRSTRARSKTPLPAISAKQSHAYGAQGKANLKAQIRTSGTDFSSAFQTSRLAAQAEEEEDEAEEEEVAPLPVKSPAKKAGGGRRIGRPSKAPVVEEEGEDDDDDDEPAAPLGAPFPDRTMTALDIGAEYARPMRRPVVERPAAERPAVHPIRPRDVPAYEPSRLRDLIVAAAALVLLLLAWAYLPSPAAIEPIREGFFRSMKHVLGIPPYDRPPDVLEESWFRFKHDEIFSKYLPDHNMPEMQWAINVNFLQRIEKLDTKVKTLQGDMQLQTETMEKLQEMLPSHVVVRVVDGKYEIPEAFWHALQEKLAADSDVAPLWQSYINRNENEIEHLNQQLVALAVDRGIEDKHIITREAFAQAIKENNDWLTARYHNELHQHRDDIRRTQQSHFDDVKDIAARTAQDILAQSPAGTFAKEQLELLTKANQVHNTYEAMRHVNWFSIGLGARVVPGLTSPTQQPPTKTWFQKLYLKLSPNVIKPHAAAMALQRWDEATDCWCGAQDAKTNGLSITVHTSAKIYPDKFVIEHIPAQGTTNIAAAPREFEVWAHATSAAAARGIDEVLQEHMRWPESPCGEKPGPEMVCVHKGKYDIHQSNHVQTFGSFVDTEAMAFGVNKFTVLVRTNWGGDWTCLYRLRMTGQRAVAA